MTYATGGDSLGRRWTRLDVVIAGVLGAVALVLRLWHLGSQLWLDEMSAMNSIGRPLGTILTQWPGSSSHILYEFLARVGWGLTGDVPVGIRLPAALFGVLGVVLTYALGRHLASRAEATFAAALLAVSYHHVFFSQNARGYTTLIFFFLAASVLLLRLWNGERRRGVLAAYAVTLVLGAYTNLFGLFVIAAHVVLLWGRWLLHRRRTGASFGPSPALWAVSAAAAVAGALYAPFVRSILVYTRANVGDPGEGPRVGGWLVLEVVEGLRAALGGTVPLLAAVAVGLLGGVIWLRGRPLALVVLVAPIVIEAVALVAMGAGIHPRYFAMALPVAFLIGATGLYVIVHGAAHVALRSQAAHAWAVGTALAAAVVVSAAPLRHYYRYPKQDYLGARRALDSLSAPGDVVAGVHLAGHVLLGYYHAPYQQVETLADLEALEGDHRVWAVTTLERLLAVHDSALLRHIRDAYRPVATFPGTVGDGAVHLYVRSP